MMAIAPISSSDNSAQMKKKVSQDRKYNRTSINRKIDEPYLQIAKSMDNLNQKCKNENLKTLFC